MGGGRTMQGVGAPTPLASGKTTNETTAHNTVTRDTHTTHTHTIGPRSTTFCSQSQAPLFLKAQKLGAATAALAFT